jgi:predicted amidophosphoribosyltransferase
MVLENVLESLGLAWILPEQKKKIELCFPDLNIVELKGIFDLGFSLSSHSCLIKSERNRTKMGEAVYQFKYKFNQECGDKIVDVVIEFLKSNQYLREAEVLVTVPPSFSSRPFEPLIYLAQRVSQKTEIKYLPAAIKRRRISKPQKRISDLKEKWENVSNAFTLNAPTEIQNKKVLLLDDLCDSGATINTISEILKQKGAGKVFVLTLTKII